jgi:hypothetical protein
MQLRNSLEILLNVTNTARSGQKALLVSEAIGMSLAWRDICNLMRIFLYIFVESILDNLTQQWSHQSDRFRFLNN